MKRISSIHEAIQSIDGFDFANPRNITDLPFPSPLQIPKERFTNVSKGDNIEDDSEGDSDDDSDDDNHDDNHNHNTGGRIQTFRYMGRTIFQKLLKGVRHSDFLDGSLALYLYGTSGVGKSHLLAALVCHLIREGKRVVYIPDCRGLRKAFAQNLRDALLFAFHDDTHSCNNIMHATGSYDLVQFVCNQPRWSLYLVVDQRNALDLDPDPDTDYDYQNKVTTWRKINLMRYSQMYLFSALATEQSARDRDGKQRGVKAIDMLKGLNKVGPHLFNFLVSCSPGGDQGLVQTSRRLAA